jgi:hypothetical protein
MDIQKLSIRCALPLLPPVVSLFLYTITYPVPAEASPMVQIAINIIVSIGGSRGSHIPKCKDPPLHGNVLLGLLLARKAE